MLGFIDKNLAKFWIDCYYFNFRSKYCINKIKKGCLLCDKSKIKLSYILKHIHLYKYYDITVL